MDNQIGRLNDHVIDIKLEIESLKAKNKELEDKVTSILERNVAASQLDFAHAQYERDLEKRIERLEQIHSKYYDKSKWWSVFN